jgi:hypothetical protein
LIDVALNCEGEESLKKQVELISRISNAENMFTGRVPFPKCEISLSKTDWELVRRIQRDPRKSYKVISKELSVSSKTVKRRIERMIEGKALYSQRTTNLVAFEGAILADLHVIYDSHESRGEVSRKIISHLDDYLYYAGLHDGSSRFFLIVSNVLKMQEIVKWVKEQQGVSSARIDILQDRIELFEQNYARKLEKKLAQIQF